MENGQGFKSLYPPLAHSDFLVENQDRIACILRQGIEGEITVNGKVYDHPMAGIPNLNPVEIHNIVNYINSSWGNKTKTLTINEIKKQLTECETE